MIVLVRKYIMNISNSFYNKHPKVPLGRWKLKKKNDFKFYDHCFQS